METVFPLTIDKYFHFLLERYNLTGAYQSFLVVAFLNLLVRESFYWFVLIASRKTSLQTEKIRIILYFLLFWLFVSIPLEYFFRRQQARFVQQVHSASLRFFLERLQRAEKSQILSQDLYAFYEAFDQVQYGLSAYINKKVVWMKLALGLVTIVLASKVLPVLVLLAILFVVYLILYWLQRYTLEKEIEYAEESIEKIENLKQYIQGSRNYLLNDTLNAGHPLALYETALQCRVDSDRLNASMYSYSDLITFAITAVIVWKNRATITPADLLLYLLITNDLDKYILTIFEGYKYQRAIEKGNLRLAYLQPLQLSDPIYASLDSSFRAKGARPLERIRFETFEHSKPSLRLVRPFEMRRGEWWLVEGRSGSGKTTFFGSLKHIHKPHTCSLVLNDERSVGLEGIYPDVYYTIQSVRPTHNGYLYDLLTNFESAPDKDRIAKALEIAQLSHLYDGTENPWVKTYLLSGGESMRFSIARMVYEILSTDRQIILLDEIDSGLDTQTAERVFSGLMRALSDRFVLCIVHSEPVKRLFSRRLEIVNGEIRP